MIFCLLAYEMLCPFAVSCLYVDNTLRLKHKLAMCRNGLSLGLTKCRTDRSMRSRAALQGSRSMHTRFKDVIEEDTATRP